MKLTSGPRAMLSRLTIKCTKHYVPNWFNCFIVCPFGQSQASIVLKSCKINAVMEIKDSNCIGILSNQEEAATASNLSEHTIHNGTEYDGHLLPKSKRFSNDRTVT